MELAGRPGEHEGGAGNERYPQARSRSIKRESVGEEKKRFWGRGARGRNGRCLTRSLTKMKARLLCGGRNQMRVKSDLFRALHWQELRDVRSKACQGEASACRDPAFGIAGKRRTSHQSDPAW